MLKSISFGKFEMLHVCFKDNWDFSFKAWKSLKNWSFFHWNLEKYLSFESKSTWYSFIGWFVLDVIL